MTVTVFGKLRVKMKGVSTISESKATFGGSGAVDAPLAIDMSRPVISQKFKSPSRKGSEGRVSWKIYQKYRWNGCA